MAFVETTVFTKTVTGLMTDEEYRVLQAQLAQNPEAGDVIPGGGGIRKLRVALQGRGKRGGGRIIYYWQKSLDRIYMLLAYPKSAQTNVDPEQAPVLKHLVKELERHG